MWCVVLPIIVLLLVPHGLWFTAFQLWLFLLLWRKPSYFSSSSFLIITDPPSLSLSLSPSILPSVLLRLSISRQASFINHHPSTHEAKGGWGWITWKVTARRLVFLLLLWFFLLRVCSMHFAAYRYSVCVCVPSQQSIRSNQIRYTLARFPPLSSSSRIPPLPLFLSPSILPSSLPFSSYKAACRTIATRQTVILLLLLLLCLFLLCLLDVCSAAAAAADTVTDIASAATP